MAKMNLHHLTGHGPRAPCTGPHQPIWIRSLLAAAHVPKIWSSGPRGRASQHPSPDEGAPFDSMLGVVLVTEERLSGPDVLVERARVAAAARAPTQVLV